MHAAEDMGMHDMVIGRDTLSFLRTDTMPFKPFCATPETHCHDGIGSNKEN